MKINIKDIQTGDIFSESPYLIYQKDNGDDTLKFKHSLTGKEVNLSKSYVENLLTTADQYEKEVVVGKEDKLWTAAQIATAIKKGEIKDGDVNVGDVRLKGIRTIFEEIGNEVFTVSFKKADKPLSKKRREELISEQAQSVVDAVIAAKKSKKSMIGAAEEAAMAIANNPVLLTEPGEDRILRGYKKQFSSRDGRYNCMDMDIMQPRPVNINTLTLVVVGGVKYILE